MGWLSGALTIIKAIPDLITVAKLAIQAYLELKEQLERAKKNREMQEALDAGDRKKVEELFGKK